MTNPFMHPLVPDVVYMLLTGGIDFLQVFIERRKIPSDAPVGEMSESQGNIDGYLPVLPDGSPGVQHDQERAGRRPKMNWRRKREKRRLGFTKGQKKI